MGDLGGLGGSVGLQMRSEGIYGGSIVGPGRPYRGSGVLYMGFKGVWGGGGLGISMVEF